MKRKLNDVQIFLPTNNNLIYVTKEKDKYFVITSSHKIEIETWVDNLFLLADSKVLIRLSSGIGVVFSTTTGDSYSLENFDSNFATEDILVFSKGGIFNRTFGVYSLTDNKEFFTSDEDIGRDIFNDRLYNESFADKTIVCRDAKTGSINWKFPLSSYGTFTRNGEEFPMSLSKYLGEHEGVLYLLAGNKLILGIDVISGQESYKFHYDESVGGLMNVELDKESNSIFSLGPYHYVEVSLDTPTCKVYDISESVNKHQVEGYRLGSWEKNLIYFYEGGNSNRFGVFDRGIKEIIWSDEIEEAKDQPAPILKVKHGGDELYVYDFNKTLHIYERF